MNEGLLTGDAETLGAVASVVFDAVKVDPIVRVKIWSRDGTIVYSDQTELIGSTYELGEDELEVIDHGGVVADVSDLSEPENRFEREFGELLEVYTRIDTDPEGDGTPLLFETYQLASSIAERRRELTSTFLPILVATLLALVLLMVPIAWILVRRVRASQRERERLMQRALDASEREQRRIAGDLHDGAGAGDGGAGDASVRRSRSSCDDPDAGVTLRSSASAVRGSVRMLRSAIVGHLPAEPAAGGASGGALGPGGPARAGTASNLARGRTRRRLRRRRSTPCSTAPRRRRCATWRSTPMLDHVRVAIARRDGRAVLEVVDDGRGIAPDAARSSAARGHMGLRDPRRHGERRRRHADGGTRRRRGTVVRVEVQAP